MLQHIYSYFVKIEESEKTSSYDLKGWNMAREVKLTWNYIISPDFSLPE